MESGVDIFYVGENADFVLVSTASITLPDLSVFYIVEDQPATIVGSKQQFFSGLKNTSIKFGADSFPPIQIDFTSNLCTAMDVVSYINDYQDGAVSVTGGFKAVEKNGFIVIETLSKGGISTLESFTENTVLGFTVGTASGQVQQNITVSDIDMQLTIISPDVYGISFNIGDNFTPRESYFLFANINPPLIQKFKVLNNKDFVSVNFVS